MAMDTHYLWQCAEWSVIFCKSHKVYCASRMCDASSVASQYDWAEGLLRGYLRIFKRNIFLTDYRKSLQVLCAQISS